jgi:paraquat-inducible protein B
MSDHDAEHEPKSEDHPQAVEKTSRWPGWIWSIPLAAMAIVAYLGFQQFAQSGPTVHVTFPVVGGLQAENTKVEYQGMEVGKVAEVRLRKDLAHVDVTLDMNPDMAGHLGKGTRFWIAGQPSITDLASIRSVITGPHIGVEPHPGDTQDHYDGLAKKPVNAYARQGTHYVLVADKLGSVTHGSTVTWHDMQVGEVEDTKLTQDRSHFTVDIFVSAPYDAMIHSGTRFWDAGAVQLATGNGGPKLEFQSLPALFQGAVALETPPEPAAGPRAKADTQFTLYRSKSRAEHAPDDTSVQYRVVFHASDAGGLDAGSPVMLMDKQIGTVTDSHLQYQPDSGTLDEIVTLGVEPWRIRLAGNKKWGDDRRAQMDEFMRKLIAQGMRARIGSTIPLVGGKTVELAFVSGPDPASLGGGDPPELPTGPESGIDGVLAAVNGVAAKINAIPLDQIAQNIHAVTQRLAALSESPQLQQSLENVEQAIDNVKQVTADAKGEVKPILDAVHRAAREAQSAVESARGLLTSNQFARNTPGQGNIGETLYEVSKAARSLRELADYLDRNPSALLKGRGG